VITTPSEHRSFPPLSFERHRTLTPAGIEPGMPTHRDTDYVSFRVDRAKFEVFTLPTEAAKYKLKKGKDVKALSILADNTIYSNIKSKRQAKSEDLEKYFGTTDREVIVNKILLNGKLKVKVYVAQPITEILLDLVFVCEIVGAFYVLLRSGTLRHFLVLCFIVAALVMICMNLSRTVGRFLSTRLLAGKPFNDPLQSDTNLRQFESQIWQLVIHSSMSAIGMWAYSKGPDFMNYPSLYVNAEQLEGKPISAAVEWLYVIQLAVWFVTLISLRFFEVRAADHHVMYSHHVTTIAVVLVSYGFGRYGNFGLVVFLLHDISDVPLDVMKLVNLLHLQGPPTYLAEASYVANMFIWLFSRVYLFPVYVIYYGVWGAMYLEKSPRGNPYWCEKMKPGLPLHQTLVSTGKQDIWKNAYVQDCECCGGIACFVLLCVLQCLHIWWSYLLLRIGYRALILGENSHEVASQEYFVKEDEDEKNTDKKKND